MKYALILLLLAGCSTAPTVTVSPVVVSDPPPKPEPKPTEHKSCPGPTSTVVVSRDSPGTVDLSPGGKTLVAWTVTVECGAISLEGMNLRFQHPDGQSSTEAIRPAQPSVFITGQSVPVSTTWVIYPHTPSGTYVITVEPIWLDSYTLKRYRGARNVDESAIRIRVSEPSNGI